MIFLDLNQEKTDSENPECDFNTVVSKVYKGKSLVSHNYTYIDIGQETSFHGSI